MTTGHANLAMLNALVAPAKGTVTVIRVSMFLMMDAVLRNAPKTSTTITVFVVHAMKLVKAVLGQTTISDLEDVTHVIWPS